MFGIVAQVSLYDYSNVERPHVFRFDESKQHGEKTENTRIVFHTHHSTIKESWKTAQVELYNINDDIWSWISDHGGNWQDGFRSNLCLKLDVGWSDFGANSSLHTIFDGSVNSFWVERQGRDNVFNFSCGMLPSLDNNTPLTIIENIPQSTSVSRYSGTRGQYIKQLFADFIYSSNYAFNKLGIKPSKDGYREWMELIKTGKVLIKIDFPIVNKLGETGLTQDQEGKVWLSSQPTKPIQKTFNSANDLKNFLSSEGAQMEGYYTEIFGDVPVFIIKLRRATINKKDYGTKVPNKNIIINHEMLTKDPSVTNKGVQLESLMRPWFEVGDFIKMEILTKEKDLAVNQLVNPQYVRAQSGYTLNLSSYKDDDKIMNVWGQETRVLDVNLRLTNAKTKSSIYNVPLQIMDVQHLGDTHGRNWHTLIQTYQPGITIG